MHGIGIREGNTEDGYADGNSRMVRYDDKRGRVTAFMGLTLSTKAKDKTFTIVMGENGREVYIICVIVTNQCLNFKEIAKNET